MKNNRLPIYAIGALVLIAIIWRIASPPAPVPPGPLGLFPTWKSMSADGKMDAQAVSPSGMMWAGAWNKTPKSGPEQSAIWIIDFNAYSAKVYTPKSGSHIMSLSWADSDTLRAVQVGSNDSDAAKCDLIYVDATTAKEKSSKSFDKAIARVISWPACSDKLVAELADKNKQMDLAVLTEKGDIVGKTVAVDLPKDSVLHTDAGLAADGSSFVFSVADPKADDGRSFYLADTQSGTARKIFDLGAVPGRIEGMWPSKAGVLVLCNVNGKPETLTYDPIANKLNPNANGVPEADLAAKWPNAPKNLMFVTYDGGFDYPLTCKKARTLFDLKKLDSEQDREWREMIRDSRLYPIKGGKFAAISETGGTIDIRELKSDGTSSRNFLTR